MKDILRNLVREQPNEFQRRCVAREYLQARILLALQDHGAFANWAFVGGTALRFLFQIPRYSEDLDFSLSDPRQDARFETVMQGVQADLTAETYAVEIRSKRERTVCSAFLAFRGILGEVGASPQKDEGLKVKIEIDTNPPSGARLETRVVRQFVMLNLLHYDRASLFAGKLHAVLMRRYTKGRDLYDLAWYLADPTWPAPNLELLNNALRQTGWEGETLTPGNWRGVVARRLDDVDWRRAVEDVSPFLAREQDVAMVSREVVGKLLETATPSVGDVGRQEARS